MTSPATRIFYLNRASRVGDRACQTKEYKERQKPGLAAEEKLLESLTPSQLALLREMDDSRGLMNDIVISAIYEAGFLERYAAGYTNTGRDRYV
jgi:hypothetical protein